MTIGLALAVLLLPYALTHQFTLTGILAFWVISVMAGISTYLAWNQHNFRASISTLLLAAISYPLIFGFLVPKLRPLWPSRQIYKIIDVQKVDENKPLLAVGFQEPSLVFYLNTKQVKFTDLDTAFAILEQDPTRMVLVDEQIYVQNKLHAKYHILFRTQAFNYSKGKWVRLLLISTDPKK